MSTAFPSTGATGSCPSFAKRFGTVAIVKARGSSRAVTSYHRSGHETGAPGSGRTENGAAIVWPRPFWSQAM